MGRRAGVERIKSKKLELGGNIESTSQPALAEVKGTYLGSHWTRWSPFTLTEQKRLELRMVLGSPKPPRFMYLFSRLSRGPCLSPVTLRKKKRGAFREHQIECIDLQLLKLLKPLLSLGP